MGRRIATSSLCYRSTHSNYRHGCPLIFVCVCVELQKKKAAFCDGKRHHSHAGRDYVVCVVIFVDGAGVLRGFEMGGLIPVRFCNTDRARAGGRSGRCTILAIKKTHKTSKKKMALDTAETVALVLGILVGVIILLIIGYFIYAYVTRDNIKVFYTYPSNFQDRPPLVESPIRSPPSPRDNFELHSDNTSWSDYDEGSMGGSPTMYESVNGFMVGSPTSGHRGENNSVFDISRFNPDKIDARYETVVANLKNRIDAIPPYQPNHDTEYGKYREV